MSDVLPRITTALDSRYRITRQVGIGGMATVFLAHDVRHERDVAIKVLHPDLAAALGAERFLAEIKTTAKLQHPHILPLLDSGEAGGLLYYVMPYVDGESLRQRLERETQLAVDDAVRIAREVLSALDYAHRHGVVHRDIKPENILIHEEQALVADFGIALAVKAAGGARMTQTGLSLGTPAYMAPEQAMGERAIDGRADIYAAGAVLYEMLVGEAPFTGPTVQAIVARVMTESPRPVTGQRKSVPQNVNAAVLRSLEKLPADRFHSAAEFSAALGSASFETRASEQSPAAQWKSKSWLAPKALIPWAVAAMAILAALFVKTKDRGADASDKPLHLAIDLPSSYELQPGEAEAMAISNDGMTIAFGAVLGDRNQIILRRLDQDLFRVVPGSLGVTGSVEFSRDGKWLAFATARKLFKAPVAGGPPTALAESRWGQMAWVGSEAIVYVKDYDTGLYRVSADGRDSATLTKPDRNKGELGHWWPQILPDGDHVLFTNYTTPAGRSKIEVLSLKSGKRQIVFEGGYFGRYVAGHLLYMKNSALMSAPFDLSGFRVQGAAVPVDLDVEVNEPSGWSAFAVAPNGTLVYRTDALRSVRLAWSDDAGNEVAAIDSAGRFTEFAVSPNARKLGLVLDGDVWTFDTERHLFTRLTESEQLERSPMFSPDGKDVYYQRDVPQYDVFKRSADGSGSEQLVLTSPYDKFATSISPDGRVLLFNEAGKDGNDIFTTSASSPQMPGTLLIGGRGSQNNPHFSPDGTWIVYTSDESGRNEVYVSPYPVGRGPARQQVSTSGGDYANWGADGRTLYYSWNGRLRKVQMDPRTGDVGKSETLNRIAPVIGWELAFDGRLIVRRLSADAERHSLKVVLNWASTLDKKN